MFGKGIRCADMVSKCANYCCVSEGQGFLLLCEVALGEMQEEIHAKCIEKLDKGKSSCGGLFSYFLRKVRVQIFDHWYFV